MGSLNTLAAEVVKINRANGWKMTTPQDWEPDAPTAPYRIPAILALIHSEATEALESYRSGDRPNFEEELGDIVIRVLDCAGGLGVDLDGAIRAKLEHNKTRGYRHGNKAV